MKRIGFKDLQLGIEKEFQNKIDKKLKTIEFQTNLILDYKYEREQLFYSLLSKAIDISEHYAVKYIIERIERGLGINERIKIFLYQSDVFEISCFPHLSEDETELLIFVSQSFFNNLTEDEQVGIIGHEIAHFLFNHLKYPLQSLIQYPFDFEKIGSFKADIVYWTKVREITADVMGLVANGFNIKAYSTVIIKHFSGLSDSSQSKFNISPLVDIVLRQYDHLANDLFFNDYSSTHPTMPLRVKVINTISQSKLIKYFGEEVSDRLYLEYTKEYNNIINGIIKGIYPELYKDDIDPKILIPMCLAIILADGNIENKELKAFEQIEKMFVTDDRHHIDIYKSFIYEGLADSNFNNVMTDLIKESIERAKRKNLTKHSLVSYIRIFLLIAASDEIIDKNELDCIYSFAREFGFSRSDIVTFIVTQYKF